MTSELRRRAAAMGVAVTYRDGRGREVTVSDETMAAIVESLGDTSPPPPPSPPPRSQASRSSPDISDMSGAAPVPRHRSFGFTVQLYSLRSRASWGHGDLRDLAEFAAWSARDLGAGFTLINPLHAAEPLPPVSDSPYLPMSRRWVSPLYLRIEDIPEYSTLSSSERSVVTALAAPLLAASSTPALIDRDAVWTAKRAALEVIRRVPLSPSRQASADSFRVRQGQPLSDWATWCAIAELHGPDYRAWPPNLRDPRSAEVYVLRGSLASRVEFHVWVQWLVASQLASARAAARSAGMEIGIVADLAVGAHPGGADAWAGQDVYVRGVSVGAPPDEFNQRGQDWSLPPWHPGRLAARRYRPLADLIDATLATPHPNAGGTGDHGTLHPTAGGLRIDHVMGLARLWWIPSGMSPARGAYVRYDHEATLGVLAASASAAGAVAIGEDLGTVEPWLRDALASRGVLGTSMLWFERSRDGTPLPAVRWRRGALATVSTHDMPPAAAFLTGAQVTGRARLGLLTRPEAAERADADKALAAWLAALAREGLISPGARPSPDEFTAALYGYLAKTPSMLIGVSLAEAVGERRSQNMPGTTTEYPNWCLPLGDADGQPVLLEDLPSHDGVRNIARAAASFRRSDH
jgi:4-alpha-glucanotransferase